MESLKKKQRTHQNYSYYDVQSNNIDMPQQYIINVIKIKSTPKNYNTYTDKISFHPPPYDFVMIHLFLLFIIIT